MEFISRELYLEVSFSKEIGEERPDDVVASADETSLSLKAITEALHEIAEQVKDGVPVGPTRVGEGFVASWRFGDSDDDVPMLQTDQRREDRRKASQRSNNDRVHSKRGADEPLEKVVNDVGGFLIPKPVLYAKASGKSNARPIYRYFPFRPGTWASGGGAQAAARALKVFAVLHAAHRGPEALSVEDLQPLFFRSSSDLITYREGWKAGRFWSVRAFTKAMNAREKHAKGLVSEHVLPRSQTLRRALAEPDIRLAARFVWDHSFECVILAGENNELTTRDASRPKNTIWEFEHGPWERYAGTSVRILDVRLPGFWLTDDERTLLRRLGLLEEWSQAWEATCRTSGDPRYVAEWSNYQPLEKGPPCG